MRFRIGSAIVALTLAMSLASVALAQADDDTPVDTQTSVDQPPPLFVSVLDPLDQDIEVALDTTRLTIQGSTLPGAVVSIDGDLVDTDDQGTFTGRANLEPGANEIDIVASDDQGNQVNTSIFVTRGE